jgi:agmatinase
LNKQGESTVHQLERLERGLPPVKDAGIFGASIPPDESTLTLIGVPWDATTSYGGGTSAAPKAILSASHQLDLEDLGFGQPFKKGIALLDVSEEIAELSQETRDRVIQYRQLVEDPSSINPSAQSKAQILSEINSASKRVNEFVEKSSKEWLSKKKVVGIIGGDHSSPYGLISALSKIHDSFGILHIDAHFDLRVAYEGFVYSHASIMQNVIRDFSNVVHLTQVGIRDFSREERLYHESLNQRASVHYSRDIAKRKAVGVTWSQIVDDILRPLPKKVYVSFDIDGLDPTLCPSTGTPVPGGLSYEDAMYLLEALVFSGRKVIGFDLCEVTPNLQNEWDANVGARVLYKLCGASLIEHKALY